MCRCYGSTSRSRLRFHAAPGWFTLRHRTRVLRVAPNSFARSGPLRNWRRRLLPRRATPQKPLRADEPVKQNGELNSRRHLVATIRLTPHENTPAHQFFRLSRSYSVRFEQRSPKRSEAATQGKPLNSSRSDRSPRFGLHIRGPLNYSRSSLPRHVEFAAKKNLRRQTHPPTAWPPRPLT